MNSVRSRAIEAHKEVLKLDKIQREVIVGVLLGDGCLESQNSGRTYRLKIEQPARHREYVDHLYGLFEDWVRTPPRDDEVRASNGSVMTNVVFATLSHPALRFFAHSFNAGGTKSVPKLIHRMLSPRAIAYWFMDDRSMKSSQSKSIVLNTQCSELPDVERLAAALSSYELEVKPRKQHDGWQLYVSGRSYERFVALVDPFVIESMRYKIPKNRNIIA